jgi:hypothetical protein
MSTETSASDEFRPDITLLMGVQQSPYTFKVWFKVPDRGVVSVEIEAANLHFAVALADEFIHTRYPPPQHVS